MDKYQKANLAKLADFLAGGGLSYVAFNMARYADHGLPVTHENCGSSGCAVGHGPYAGVPKMGTENWREYCARAFGVNEQSSDYDFLFGQDWVNTVYHEPEDAAERIRAYLAADCNIHDMFENADKYDINDQADACYWVEEY